MSTLISSFLKLGILGFGGPAAHIAMMREEFVVKRRWLSEQDFLDLVGAVNLIPGPNSTELAIHIGHKMKGWKGLVVAGVCFILPAFLIVLGTAVLYTKFGKLPELSPILSGIRPVIISIILIALFQFRKSALKGSKEITLAVAVILGAWFGLNEVLMIFLAGFFSMSPGFLTVGILPKVTPAVSISSSSLFAVFLKIGSVLFGSGYVLLAFLKSEFVDQRGWLTNTQLMDAITVGQFTPGPVFTTATFIGFVLDSYQGAIAATIGIFLPSFAFVALSAPFILRMRESKKFSLFLDGVNAASFALMAYVSFLLGTQSITSFPTVIIGLASFLVLKFTKVNSAWPILLGGIIGYLFL